jgi:diguanylate cyclase (GGDEF)-like protein
MSELNEHLHTSETHPLMSEAELDRLERFAMRRDARLAELETDNKFLIQDNLSLIDTVDELQNKLESSHDEKVVIAQGYQRLLDKNQLDQLTGIKNRVGLSRVYDRILEGRSRNRREEEQKEGEENLDIIAFIDLDRFKHANDQYGHAAGDEILINIATLLESSIRPNDAAGKLGGDEFVLLLQRVAPDGLVPLMERIRQGIETIGKPYGGVTGSIGVVKINPEWNFEAALLNSDNAMYQAKAAGKNRTFYSDEFVIYLDR